MSNDPFRDQLRDSLPDLTPEQIDALTEQARAAGQRFRAALRLLSPDHITPQGRRILEKVLDAEGEPEKGARPWATPPA